MLQESPSSGTISGVSRAWQVGHVPWRHREVLAPNVLKNICLNNFLEVIFQKPCNTHRHEYLERLLINNKCKTQF
jgi:hypothetical protein